MKYAIIAAGLGSRLVEEGITTPKPLIPIAGEPIIDRLIHTFESNGADSIHVVINAQMVELRHHLEGGNWQVPLHVTVADTPNSMDSLYRLMPQISMDKVCVTTVDTLFLPNDFSQLISAFCSDNSYDGYMAVTQYIDDESPLYVEVDKAMQITQFLDQRPTNVYPYVSGGIFCLTPKTFETLERAIGRGEMRMRNFQRAMLADGLRLKAFPFSKIMDIDHRADIDQANCWLASLKVTKP